MKETKSNFLFPMARLFLAWSTQKEHTYGEEAEAESGGGVDSSWGPAVDKLLLSFLKQGELVWLKRFEGETAPELRPSCLRVLRKVGQRAWRVGCGGVLSGDPYWSGLVPTQCRSS